MDGMAFGVYLDLNATSPEERYKLATGSNGAGGVALSKDGLTWQKQKDLVV